VCRAMLLQVDRVSKTFPSNGSRPPVKAIEGLEFSVEQGEFVTILGPSGCGKTTLLRLLAGLDAPTTGRILFQGTEVKKPGRERVLTFQAYSSFPWLSVERNISFGLHGDHISHKDLKQRVSRLLELVGLSDFRHALPHELSGGMQQRLAIARCLAVEPRVMLLDEPFSSVDAITRTHLQKSLREIVDSVGTTTVLVTHDVEESISLSDRILVLSARPASMRFEAHGAILSSPWRDRVRESVPFQEFRKDLLLALDKAKP